MKQKILDGLNRISETLVLCDFIDLSPLGQACTEFSELGKLAREHENESLGTTFDDMAQKIESIIFEEDKDRDSSVKELNGFIAALSGKLEGMEDLSADWTSDIEPENIPDSSKSNQTIDEYDDEDISAEFIESIEKDPDVSQDFVLEATDHLDSCTPALLELEKQPDDPDNINLVFRCFHSIKGVAGFLNLKSIQNISHYSEDILDRVRSGKLAFDKSISNLIFEASDALRVMVEYLGAMIAGEDPEPPDLNINDLASRLKSVLPGDSSNSQAPEQSVAMANEKALGNTFTVEPVDSSPEVQNSPEPPFQPPQTAKRNTSSGPRTAVARKEVIKVDADRLNRLIDIIGELVIAETIVLESEETRSHYNPTYLRKISQLDKITRELQTMGMSMRMVAVKSTFMNMARIVRDLADKQNKNIDFVMNGEETEIDKNIVDKIGDPLVHMIRNAVDHGIEKSQEDRISAGKDPIAKIEIRAFHRGGNICIEIEDDGRGINPEVIFKKAVDKGLVSPDASLSKSEIINLLFAPGFSTAEKITDVSGRGVGMDVVRKNITELNGTVEINSEPGKGSVVTVKLPLTLAIIDGMVVRVANERYIVPTLSITRAVNITTSQIHDINGREFVYHQNSNIPVYRLNRFLDISDTNDNDNILMLILDNEDSTSGIIVDELVGKQQIVIKSLGEAFRHIDGYSGCAILSDGSVGLIIDVNNVIKNYHNA